MSRMIRIKINDRSLRQGLMRADRRIKKLLPPAGNDAIEETIKPDSQNVVPLRTGALQNSWYLKDRRAADAYIWYMGYKESYAVVQHENPDYQHAPGRHWQYLWIPMVRQFRRMVELIAEKLRP